MTRSSVFPSLTAFVDHVAALPWDGRGPKRESAEDVRWAGGTWAESLRFASHGWPEGSRLASQIATRIADRTLTTSGTVHESVITYDVQGAAYDPIAYQHGVPECWARPDSVPARKAVHIIVNISVSSGISPEVVRRRGFAVSALALALNARGYPLTIDVCAKHNNASMSIRLADAQSGSQLDVDRIVAGLAHPTIIRRLVRAYTNGYRCNRCRVADTWGPSTPYSNWYPESADLTIGGVHLSEMERWRDGGEAWVLAEYERQTTGGSNGQA